MGQHVDEDDPLGLILLETTALRKTNPRLALKFFKRVLDGRSTKPEPANHG